LLSAVAAAVVAWHDDQVTITTPALTVGAKTIALTTSDGETATMTNGYTVFPVAETDPILTRIEAAIESLINGLSVAVGYNYNHGVVNQSDRAHWDLSKVNHIVDLDPEIENLEQVGLAVADRYAMRARFSVNSYIPLGIESTNPKKAANPALNACLDDLQRVFGRSPDASHTCTVIQIESAERASSNDGDRFYPKLLTTRWRVDYTQSRFNPEQFAN
jgi:hypothetical protein